ncbi:MAG: hypothetical protein QHJ73_06225 [Armatimonadota bacterium]|nr:hypothetical protein [Armatimonadota bacterium]
MNLTHLAMWSWVSLVGVGWLAASAPRQDTLLPKGAGLSARYPRDTGIASDPAVLFADDFERGSVPEIGARWGQMNNKDGKVISLSDDVPPNSGGKRSLLMTATLGHDQGGHLYTRFRRGVDQAYARFYVKFPNDAEYIHHFVWMGGHNPPTPYPHPRAGTRPEGHERFSVGIEPHGGGGRYPAPGAWNFYCYWNEMKISADGKYWGNGLHPARPVLIPRERWICVEFMVKLNSAPELRDGELALWIDGEPVAHFRQGVPRTRWTGMGFQLLESGGEPFEGFRWRTSNDLKINYFWLEHYVTDLPARQNRVEKPNPVNRVWFDDVVVSTRYVGPLSP